MILLQRSLLRTKHVYLLQHRQCWPWWICRPPGPFGNQAEQAAVAEVQVCTVMSQLWPPDQPGSGLACPHVAARWLPSAWAQPTSSTGCCRFWRALLCCCLCSGPPPVPLCSMWPQLLGGSAGGDDLVWPCPSLWNRWVVLSQLQAWLWAARKYLLQCGVSMGCRHPAQAPGAPHPSQAGCSQGCFSLFISFLTAVRCFAPS